MNEQLEHKTVPFEFKDLDDTGYFKGYASTFGGDPDLGGDVIVKGAFTETIAKRGKFGSSIKMLWSHNHSIPPIGIYKSFEENSKGLAIEGNYALQTQMGKEVHSLSKMGAIDSLSIGYETLDSEPGKGKIRRYLKKLDLYEISPVNFPMNPKARITAVKSMLENVHNERELEDCLREAGLSREVSKYIVYHMKKSLFKDCITPDKELFNALRDANAGISGSELYNALKSANEALSQISR